ncbi:hypothetical protein HCN44_007922 [Aphidius gifuensis]|uniref:Uncharacterized protein n=1 Tax=Aphidius gifuensis TaxID=684658 RepID=A0A834XYL5_APHGI|nr:hypothetical protein HCN44_007922 [Aphidius gifuensis]
MAIASSDDGKFVINDDDDDNDTNENNKKLDKINWSEKREFNDIIKESTDDRDDVIYGAEPGLSLYNNTELTMDLLLELETLDDLVHKFYLGNMSLVQLEKLHNLDKIKLLMSTSEDEKPL